MTLDLTTLPAPQVIEEVSFEVILARKKAKFQELWEAVRVDHPELPDYDVSMLETDPVVIVLEADAYDEMLLRSRANDVAKSNLLAFSVGADLRHLAADHGVEELEGGESDTALRQRVILHDQGSSAAGSEEWYEFHARSASVLVEDAAVYRSGTGPEITVAILSTDNGGVPTPELLQVVRDKVTSRSVRVLSDVVSVVAATAATVNVAADVWLLPEAPASIYDSLEAVLRTAMEVEGGIGFDINISWLTAKLMVPGVSKVIVTSPATDVVMPGHSAAALGTVVLTLRGRSR